MIGMRRKTSPAGPQKNGSNPYLNAREEWLERYGNYINRASQWRWATFLTLVVAALSIAGNVMQVHQNKIIPYVVMMDDLGNIAAGGRADQVSATSERVIQAAIAGLIESWRTVTVDTELQKRMLANLTAHTAGAAKGFLKQWFDTNNPYNVAKAGKLVNVEIRGLPLPVSKGSYRVEWAEIVRNYAGAELTRQNFEAICTVEIVPPSTEEVIVRNPGGVYVTSISAAKMIGK